MGFRPLVFRLAKKLNLCGIVLNDGLGVGIEVQGPTETLHCFLGSLLDQVPHIARIDSQVVSEIPIQHELNHDELGFKIIESQTPSSMLSEALFDIAPCKDCLKELLSKENRRYLYPLISCTSCGPRYSIQHGSPFDRQRTTLAPFDLCKECRTEYLNPADRRFHSQTIGCFGCGPQWTWIERNSIAIQCNNNITVMQALDRFETIIRDGGIVLLKGVGGYQFICDARCKQAALQLREIKHRRLKPFALQFGTIQQAMNFLDLSCTAKDYLQGDYRPIIIGRRIHRVSDHLGDWISETNQSLGVMLPSSPMHALLASRISAPLIVTSANVSGEPMLIDDDEAIARFASEVDGVFTNNRLITQPLEDPVACDTAKGLIPIRLGRGNTPLQLAFRSASPQSRNAVALGADLKVAWSSRQSQSVYIMQQLGDASEPQVLDRLESAIVKQWEKESIKPNVLTDMHPGYLTTRVGEKLAKPSAESSQTMTHQSIQHHAAHLGSLAMDCGIEFEKPFLGFVFDGTGYGPDQSIWGGELIAICRSDYLRLGHLMPFRLPKGDVAAKHPWRSAMGLIDQCGIEVDGLIEYCDWAITSPWGLTPAGQRASILKASKSEMLTIGSSSMGRFLEGLTSLIGLVHTNDYEGHAAMLLEDRASDYYQSQGSSTAIELKNRSDSPRFYRFAIHEEAGVLFFDGRGVVKSVLEDLRCGASVNRIAFGIHDSIAAMMATALDRLRLLGNPVSEIGLTGGVFQNRLLTELAVNHLEARNCRVYLHQRIPPNDSGIAVGQIRLQTI